MTINSTTKTLADFEPATTIADQKDFITATATGSKTDEAAGVALTFGHRLSQIEIKAKNTNEKAMAGMSRESAIAATIPGFWEQILERSGKIYGLLDILRIPEIQTKALQWKKDVLYLPWNLMRRRYLKIVENTGKLRIIYIGSWMSISMKTIPEEEIYQH